ncbi:hypothetical protein BELINDA_208 [Bacillus phage Belinda]|uniref:hypothetical protein n=1 Tax=Bacillus phage Belinda TaxID=1852564 RepID=UPI0007F169B9|nr:hypothetical protein BI039_gp170 [Bacillus phage Belinda]ANM46134.1 hypothetical protein BELINDA_208 [Bacillus phage Belinda]
MKKTHILQNSIVLRDENNMRAVDMPRGTEVVILHAFDEESYSEGKAVVIFDGKEAVTVAANIVHEKKLTLKQHQDLCPKHANELWSTFPYETIIMKRVYTKEECDACKEEFHG